LAKAGAETIRPAVTRVVINADFMFGSLSNVKSHCVPVDTRCQIDTSAQAAAGILGNECSGRN
jgi:hypothetical protein